MESMECDDAAVPNSAQDSSDHLGRGEGLGRTGEPTQDAAASIQATCKENRGQEGARGEGQESIAELPAHTNEDCIALLPCVDGRTSAFCEESEAGTTKPASSEKVADTEGGPSEKTQAGSVKVSDHGHGDAMVRSPSLHDSESANAVILCLSQQESTRGAPGGDVTVRALATALKSAQDATCQAVFRAALQDQQVHNRLCHTCTLCQPGRGLLPRRCIFVAPFSVC
jgi:hypothetical protein